MRVTANLSPSTPWSSSLSAHETHRTFQRPSSVHVFIPLPLHKPSLPHISRDPLRCFILKLAVSLSEWRPSFQTKLNFVSAPPTSLRSRSSASQSSSTCHWVGRPTQHPCFSLPHGGTLQRTFVLQTVLSRTNKKKTPHGLLGPLDILGKTAFAIPPLWQRRERTRCTFKATLACGRLCSRHLRPI